MSKCQLCDKQEDEKNIQEQAGYSVCLSCDCKYTDNELIQLMQLSMLDNYNLYEFHSGGGCMHFAYDTDIDELQWLINDVDESKEPSQQYPTNKNQRCMFGLYYGYIDSKLGAKVKKELFYSSSLPNWQFYDEGFYFYDTLENGVSKMKEVTQSINNLLKEKK